MTKLLNEYAFCTYPTLSKFRAQIFRPSLNLYASSRALLFFSNTSLFNIIASDYSFSSFKCFYSRNDNAQQVSSQSFSALDEDIPWDGEDIFSTMAFYMLSLHVPLSFGWMSLASQVLHLQQHDLDPRARAISLLVAQNLELAATFVLLKLTAKRQFKFEDLFKPSRLSKDRNWLLASALGIGFLLALVVVTSFLLDRVFGPKAFNNPAVKEILLDDDIISKSACVIVYCINAPLLEETVYRGFLLRSLSSTMKWQKAVLISAAVFSAAHLSGENFVQLFIIGCVLGCSYSWTGNLSSSIAIHSLYNAITLIITALL